MGCLLSGLFIKTIYELKDLFSVLKKMRLDAFRVAVFFFDLMCEKVDSHDIDNWPIQLPSRIHGTLSYAFRLGHILCA